MKKVMWMMMVAISASLLSGCVTGSETSPALEALAAEAASMGQADLEAMVSKYKALISEKVDVLAMLKAQLSEIPVAEMMGEKAAGLREEIGATGKLIAQLKEKLAVYVDALKAFQ
jgi:hypothetical protein